MPLLDWLYRNGSILTHSCASRLAGQRAIKVNGETVTNLLYEVYEGDQIQIGKHRFHTVEFED